MIQIISIEAIETNQILSQIQKPIVFADMVRDIQALRNQGLEFKELIEKYFSINIRVFELASNWVLTGEK